MICPFCGGPAVMNGGTRAKCKVCMRSFNKSEGETWKRIKNNKVVGTEVFPAEVDIEQLI